MVVTREDILSLIDGVAVSPDVSTIKGDTPLRKSGSIAYLRRL